MNASLVAAYFTPNVEIHLEALESVVRSAKYTLEHPTEGQIYEIDPEGERWSVSREQLRQHLSERREVRLQFWEKEWAGRYPADLYFRCRFTTFSTILEFGELPANVHGLLTSTWCAFAAEAARGRALGYILDFTGEAEEYAEWDTVIMGGRRYSGPLPDVLCMRAPLMQEIAVSESDYDVFQLGILQALWRRNLPRITGC